MQFVYNCFHSLNALSMIYKFVMELHRLSIVLTRLLHNVGTVTASFPFYIALDRFGTVPTRSVARFQSYIVWHGVTWFEHCFKGLHGPASFSVFRMGWHSFRMGLHGFGTDWNGYSIGLSRYWYRFAMDLHSFTCF